MVESKMRKTMASWLPVSCHELDAFLLNISTLPSVFIQMLQHLTCMRSISTLESSSATLASNAESSSCKGSGIGWCRGRERCCCEFAFALDAVSWAPLALAGLAGGASHWASESHLATAAWSTTCTLHPSHLQQLYPGLVGFVTEVLERWHYLLEHHDYQWWQGGARGWRGGWRGGARGGARRGGRGGARVWPGGGGRRASGSPGRAGWPGKSTGKRAGREGGEWLHVAHIPSPLAPPRPLDLSGRPPIQPRRMRVLITPLHKPEQIPHNPHVLIMEKASRLRSRA